MVAEIDALPEGLEGYFTESFSDALFKLRQAIAEKENALQALHNENERLGLYKDAYAEQEPVAWKETHGKVIKALAGIVNVHTPDKLFDLDAIPREPVMGLVQQIKVAIDAYQPQRTEPEQEQSFPSAMKTVIKAMQSDPDYAWAWHCNIAMAFVDAGGDSYTGNQGAARFMKLFANVEPAYKLPAQSEQELVIDKSAAVRIATALGWEPKREWVGLTDEEKHKTWYEMQNIMGWYSFQEIARAIEAKLKQKNGYAEENT